MKKKLDAVEHDPNMKIENSSGNFEIKWHKPQNQPIRLSGFYWYNQYPVYRRFPNDESLLPQYNLETGKVGPGENGATNLSWHISGGQIQFKTDSTRLAIRAKFRENQLMSHMAQTGHGGFDVYCAENDVLRFVKSTRYEIGATKFELLLLEKLTKQNREFLISFPLYNDVLEVEIGLDEDSEISAPTPWREERPIVVYGTSITQGGCAGRPGMSYTNILSRKLNQEILNFGFSGSGKGEPEVANLLGEIKKPALYIIDYIANVSVEQLRATLTKFIDILRTKHSTVPILILSEIMFNNDAITFNANNYSEKKTIFKNNKRRS